MGSHVSPIVVNMYVADLEQKIIATAPEDCQPRSWKRYVDYVICLVHTYRAEKLQQHINTVDSTGMIVFTREERRRWRKQECALLGCQVHQKRRWKREVHRVQEEDAHWPVAELWDTPPQTSEAMSCQNLRNRCQTITTEKRDKK